jgi:Na+/proline symporter
MSALNKRRFWRCVQQVTAALLLVWLLANRLGAWFARDINGSLLFGSPVRSWRVVQICGLGLITSHLTGFSFELGILVALLAALIAALRVTDILQFVSATFSLAAAAFVPALVLGIFWRRANHAGAVAGMVTGLALCGRHMAVNLPFLRTVFNVTRPLADGRWWGIEGVAAATFAVPAGVLAMVVFSLLGRAPLAEQQRWLDGLRYPSPDER